jgi:uncharacterized protein YegP (UPF0339 family)
MLSRRLFVAFALIPFLAGVAAAADTMTFEVYADAKDEFRWRLLNAEGKNVATSGQGYARKTDCTKMVSNLKEDISKYSFELYKDNKMESRFRIKAKNGNVVGASTSGFEKEPDCKSLVEAIQKGCKDAKVKEIEK